MTKPKRIQRKRTKGWRMPEGAVYVGRPTRWGNPWRVGQRTFEDETSTFTAESAVAKYRWSHQSVVPWFLEPLRGHDLACWCPLDQPCHADVLLELANR